MHGSPTQIGDASNRSPDANTAPEAAIPWSAGLNANPFSAPQSDQLSPLVGNTAPPPPFLIPIYRAAGQRYHIPWQILAAINAIESDYGSDVSISSAGAIGWMQFMPDTWARYGVDVDRKGKPNPYDPRDAIFSAARYLADSGAATDLRRAIFAYNHAVWYVDEVLSRARNMGPDVLTAPASTEDIVDSPAGAPASVADVIAAGIAIARLPYIWGGGHGSFRANGYDCSGSVSYALAAGRLLGAPLDSTGLESWGLPGPGRWITVYANSRHTFMVVAGWRFDTVALASGGTRWSQTMAGTEGFVARHPSGL